MEFAKKWKENGKYMSFATRQNPHVLATMKYTLHTGSSLERNAYEKTCTRRPVGLIARRV